MGEVKIIFSGGGEGKEISFAGGNKGPIKIQNQSNETIDFKKYPNITLQAHPEYEQRIEALEDFDSNGTINGGVIF